MSDVLKEARDAARAIAKLSEPRGGRDTAWGTVVSVKGPRVDVMIGGTVSGALRYTRGCEGMAEGDRVMVQFVGREPVVVNVISNGEPRIERIKDGLTLAVSGKTAVLTANFLNVPQASTTVNIAQLPEWCVPADSMGQEGEWIGYLFVRGASGVGQLTVNTAGSITAYSSTAGSYNTGQVVFMLK